MADHNPEPTATPEPDDGFAEVVAEILIEAEQRRASGDYPEDLLAEIDQEFLRWAPVTYRQGSVDDAIRAVESASFINVEVPIAASRRGVAGVKSLLRKATAFYHMHIAGQVTALGIQVGRALRLLADKVDGLDDRVKALELATSLDHQPAETAPIRLPAWVTDHVVSQPDGLAGRVLVTDAGTGDLVRALAEAGRDVYGATTQHADADDPLLVPEPTMGHLRALPCAALGALVLANLEGSLTAAAASELVHLAAERVALAGTLVVIATDPDRWADAVGPVVVDLAPGKALHASTWAFLVERAGFTVEVTERDGVSLLWATR